MSSGELIIEQPGPLALLQDLGRAGLAHLGVSPSGAADRTAFRLGNRMVGNWETAVTIETTLGGLVVVVQQLTWVAVTGAPTQVVVNDTPTSSHTTITLRAGDRLRIDPPPLGLRNYLAVRGGLRAAATLGSRSSDVLSGLGPEPLRAGQRFELGRPKAPLPDTGLAPPNQPAKSLPLWPGPRRDWFTGRSWRRLVESVWTVTSDCNRVGVRLSGPPLARKVLTELPSEGLIRGAIQVPPSGQPLIFLADHPVTGGYPVIAVLADRARDHAAQLKPGDKLKFELAGRG
jgi:biotin-dependent carboxylase-like uncharacterized protein